MKHKNELTIKQQTNIIEYLRKQRDGLIIGTYRNTLANTYLMLLNSCKEKQKCNLETLFNSNTFTSEHDKNAFIDSCLDLEQLGYIQFVDNFNVLILKTIDF